MRGRFASISMVALLANACSAQDPIPVATAHHYSAGLTSVNLTTADVVHGGPCSVSSDGFVWYALPEGRIPPIDFQKVRCTEPATIDASEEPSIPAWAVPGSQTQAIFVLASLQEKYSLLGMQSIEHLAREARMPVTWLVGNRTYLTENAKYYNQFHASAGDDVELVARPPIHALAKRLLPWFSPAVAVEGAGHERNLATALELGDTAFWGITWNSHGTDGTADEGAPWGTYCADPTSYKRPSRADDCRLLAVEWTARDLTRAYFGGARIHSYSAEAAFSTDPDDILLRGGFTQTTGAAYVTALVDAYAAAGAAMPLVMVAQQESAEQGVRGAEDGAVLKALYAEANRVGMRAMTLRQAVVAARAFSAKPRAVAFPFIAGGKTASRNGAAFFPATIDYHDNLAGMTFAAGHSLPERVFNYARSPVSVFDLPLAATYPADPDYPILKNVSAAKGFLSFAFHSPVPTHFGVAIWTDPKSLGVEAGPNVTPAGRAGFVASFDLPAGDSVQNVACGSCTSTTFEFSR